MATALATQWVIMRSIEMIDFLGHQIQEILAPIQCQDVAMVGCNQSWPDRVTLISDVETVCKLETTSWNILAPSVFFIKTPGAKAGSTKTRPAHVRTPGHVWPDEWRCGHTDGEHLQRVPTLNWLDSEKPERDLSKVLANGSGCGGLSWRWKPPSGSLVLASCPVLWIAPCFMFQLAQLGGRREHQQS